MHKLETTRYATYLRKSQDREDRQVQSIPDQRRVLKPLIEERGLTVSEELSEARSAKTPGRPKFRELINKIKAGKIDGIICWKLNRLARNPQEGGEIQQLLQDGLLRSIITPGREYLTTDNQLMMAVELGMANQYSLDLSQDIRRGLDQKASRGIFPVGAKPGYAYDDHNPKGEKVLLVDELRFPLLQRAMKLIASGEKAPARMFETLNEEWKYLTPPRRTFGGKPMARSMFYKILCDTFYYGDFEYPSGSGNWYKGTHTPMITQEEFDRIQMVLGKKGRPRPSKHFFPFTGTLRCGNCDASITAIEQWQVICSSCKCKFSSKNTTTCPVCTLDIADMERPSVLHYIRYHCTKKKNPECPEGSIETTELEKQTDNILSKMKVSKRFETWAIQCLNDENEKEVGHRNAQLNSVQAAYKDCVQRLDNLMALKISPNNTNGDLLSDQEYLARKKELLHEKQNIETRMDGVGERITDWTETLEKMFNYARYARYWFKHGSKEEQKAIMSSLGLNLVITRKELLITGPSLFVPLIVALQEEPSIAEGFELEKSAVYTSNKANLEKLWDRSPALSGE